MRNHITRREFLATTGLTAGGLLSLSGRASAQPGSVRVRRSVFSPSAPIADYRAGVGVMKGRPITDPTSWLYQANLHGTSSSPPQGTLWRQCQHGSFFFLSWHRMFVYYFERIVRKACGNNAFALPYWDYTSASLSARQLPLGFRQPTFNGAINPLYNPSRAAGMNNLTNPAALSQSATQYSVAFAYTNFSSPTGNGLSFGGQRVANSVHNGQPHGQIELQPHDVIHGQIGGPNGDMNFPSRSARDPIFWLHHANIDRLWKRWLQQGGGRTNPTSNTVWMNTEFNFFDENGTRVALKGEDILDTVAQLQYRYDDEPEVLSPAALVAVAAPPEKEKAMTPIATSEKEGIVLGARPVLVTVALKESAQKAVERVAKSAEDAANNPITLQLDDVTFDRSPGIYYEVYLNLPADGEDPEFHNGHYVGNVAIFADEPGPNRPAHAHAAEKLSFQFDITGLVRDLVARKKWDKDNATVTFVPRGLEDANGFPLEVKTDAQVKIGKVTFQSTKE